MMPPPASRTSIIRLINASQHGLCPCHGGGASHNHHHNPVSALNQLRKFATPVQLPSDKEYAFEVHRERFTVLRCNLTDARLLPPTYGSVKVLRQRSEWISRI